MRLTSLLSGRTAEDRRETEESAERGGDGVRERLAEEARSGRLAIAAGVLWIARGLRSSGGRGRRLALGAGALAVGLLQRRSRGEGSTLPEGDLTETIRDVGPDAEGNAESEMTDVELGDGEPAEPPEDIQSDMEASDEMTHGNDAPEADADDEMIEETPAGDEHETDVGTAGEDETGIDLGSEADAEDESDGEGEESMAVETDADEADDDTPPDAAESSEGDEDDET